MTFPASETDASVEVRVVESGILALRSESRDAFSSAGMGESAWMLRLVLGQR